MRTFALIVFAVVLKIGLVLVGFRVLDEVRGRLTIRQNVWIAERFPWPIADRWACHGNESSVVSTLRNISSAEAHFGVSARADEDHDGVGEFGTFREMSGAAAVRGHETPLNPPILSGAFRTLTEAGEVTRSGYLFRIWLVGRGGRPVAESADGLAAGVTDPDACETEWRCYAWPQSFDHTGLRTFVVDESGDIFEARDERYSGTGAGPAGDAATGRPSATATSFTGADGNVWRQVN